LTFEPPQGVNTNLANAGDFVEIPATTNDFKVSADKKIAVSLYMVGQSAQTGDSDPAMVMVVPTEQYRNSYLFFAATTWNANYVDVIAPNGANVTVDGNNVNNFAMIGATGYSIAHVTLSNNGNGNHTVMSNQKVGISVYGVQSYGSYWYPGGLDLDLIPQ
ncbi:MAG: IgGFc-binding protein, partial [Myxococcales bacterium]|nr:IgGFc-binding protein [Myxococcales bacterium]